MADDGDTRLHQLVAAENTALRRVLGYVQDAATQQTGKPADTYDQQLLDLRDQIAEARLEDVPPLIERMSQLQHIGRHRGKDTRGVIQPGSPYFARIIVEEQGKQREVLIGTATYLDTSAGLRIVDWRDAPVSRLYYRYEEGDDYVETFGDQEREGEIVLRRGVTIEDGVLRRVAAPCGVATLHTSRGWSLSVSNVTLTGGQGTSTRVENSAAKLGTDDQGSEDRRLKQITALIDQRQFDLITRPDSGLVVIQGGAGSGKTTIGLHRMAYLNFHNRRRFAPNKMLIVVFNTALARYMSAAVPALGLEGTRIRTFAEWATELRRSALPQLKLSSDNIAPTPVTRLMRHPAMLTAIGLYVQRLKTDVSLRLSSAAPANSEIQRQIYSRWVKGNHLPLMHQVQKMHRWVEKAAMPSALKHELERALHHARSKALDILSAWSELITDHELLQAALKATSGPAIAPPEVTEALQWCDSHTTAIIDLAEIVSEDDRDTARKKKDDIDESSLFGGDGQRVADDSSFSHEDDGLLLALSQRMRGPLLKPGSKQALVYEHIFVDEAQDLSPLELSALMGAVSSSQSVTLAGDVAQRLHMDNGFTSWQEVLPQLSLRHVEVEPLKLSYRSTQPIIEFAHHVLGHLAPSEMPEATRSGAPVEFFRFAHIGEAVAFLASSLRDLSLREPRASIALITRHPAQADLYYRGLLKAETPGLRRINDQDFPFKPGVDITDVRQVKGLEFDYVIITDVNDAHYTDSDESRHLLHIAATRAAHQLWLLATESVSSLIPSVMASAPSSV